MKKTELISAMETITPAPGMEQRILVKTTVPARKPIHTLRRTAAALVAAVMLLTVGAFAANPDALRISGSSGSNPNYTELPTQAQCMDDVGFVPQLTEAFSNGYTFSRGYVVSNQLETKNGNPISRYKSLMLTYTKDSDSVAYDIRHTLPTDSSTSPVVATVNDISLMYSSYTNKLVPENYKLTEQDKTAQAEGVVFSWGGNTVEIHEVQSLFWEQNGLRHCLLQTDSTLTVDELVAMAAELITG